MGKKSKLICDKCQVEMVEMDTQFLYLDRSFRHKVLRCPKCGQIFIPEQLARVRMREVEATIEDK